MNMPSLDITVFANPTMDTIKKDGKKFNRVGGPPSYMNSVLNNSGVSYSVVSKVGSDFPTEEVSFSPIIAERPSTKFILEYFNGGRNLFSPEACEPIKPSDVKTKSKVAVVSGVFCEVLPETLEEIRKKSEIIAADVQGFIRKKTKDNEIFNVKLEETEYKNFIKNVDYLKASEDEIGFLDVENLKKFLTIIITRGRNGCTIIDKNKSVNVKTNPITEVDPTGAGDCFLAGVGIGLVKGFDIIKSCEIGNYFGGLSVKVVGVPDIRKEDFNCINIK